ncbi:NAD-dependent epimerase/dehydratase family protein [Bacteriovorax sp. DB6_IX]|uniref:NAD-dependent epimerase/dehydratase family protein n=1 Tax=Bacteriovorax sp. DB6_IX TaxID=1353530 RepID=UPI00038A2D26|nr:NAD-dependent epimerase/dehydratase family protein [Bacteriovorax sp. DB6_IX]EQC51668.1 NAD(P)H-binding protein, PF13460 family [Bacteriovorax sp. DB6_IX]
MRAIIIGATGLVGKELTQLLDKNSFYESIEAYGRNLKVLEGVKLTKTKIKIFDSVEKLSLGPEDHVYCCVGTTIKKAGSQENFIKVDYEIPLELSKLCQTNQVAKLIIISALGASASSKVFYNRVKGEMEEHCRANFSKTVIIRPSLLLGERDEQRIAEGLGQFLMPLLNPLLQGSLKKFRAISAREVARSMFEVANYGRTNIAIDYVVD